MTATGDRRGGEGRGGGHPALRSRIAAAALAALVALSCGRPGDVGVEQRPAPSPRSPVLIGLIPEHNIFRQLERYRPLAAYVSSRIDRPIELKILPRYGSIVSNFNTIGLDGAFFGSFTYALAHREINVVPVARPVSLDGRSTYFGMILVRKESAIRSPGALKGKRFAFVDAATTAGYLLPLHWLAKNGVADYRRFFGEYYFAGTHEDVIRDVLNGRADAGATKNTVLDRMSQEDPSITERLVVLARSPDVPENGLALRGDCDPRLREAIRATLLGMETDTEGQVVLSRFGALRFIETTDADYEPVYRYAREAGIELAEYEVVNH